MYNVMGLSQAYGICGKELYIIQYILKERKSRPRGI
jgi:hypothetical protein